MLEKLLEVLIRIAVALEKVAANGGGGFVAEKNETKAEKPKKEKAEKAAAETKPEPEKKPDPFGDDDAPAPKRTKEEVRKVLTEYANATSNDVALGELAKVTSNKAQRVPDIKVEEYTAVFDAFSKLLEATKK